MKTFFDKNQIITYIEKFELHMIVDNIDQLLIKEYDEDEIILEMGDSIEGMYIQVSGKYHVVSDTSNGKSLLLRHSTPFSIIGDIEYFQNVPIQSNVIADERTQFLFISKQLMDMLFSKNAEFLGRIIYEVTYKLQSCTTASKINILSSVEERFASLFCTLYTNQEVSQFSHKELKHFATLIGTTTRHLNRIIKKFEHEKIIEKKEGIVTVTNWAELMKIADGLKYE